MYFEINQCIYHFSFQMLCLINFKPEEASRAPAWPSYHRPLWIFEYWGLSLIILVKINHFRPMEVKFLCTRGTSHSASMPEALEVARNVRWDMQMNQTVLQRRAKKPQVPPESSLLHNPGSCLSAEMRWERCIDLASQRGFCAPAERLDSAAPVASDLCSFWGRARERNKRNTQKSQSVVHLGEKSSFLTSEVWELVIVITLQVLRVCRGPYW